MFATTVPTNLNRLISFKSVIVIFTTMTSLFLLTLPPVSLTNVVALERVWVPCRSSPSTLKLEAFTTSEKDKVSVPSVRSRR